ncbi:c-opsin [Sarotherodon galilaeus]
MRTNVTLMVQMVSSVTGMISRSHLRCFLRPQWRRRHNGLGCFLLQWNNGASGDAEASNRHWLYLLAQPNIIVPASMDGVSEARQQGLRVSRGSSFTISCSIQPQYPGGSFQLTFTSSNTAYNYTQPAVNHSAHFLFPVTEPAHQGNYSCFYHVYVFSHNFSSESRQLCVTVSDHPDPTGFIIRALVLTLILLLESVVLYLYCKTSRGQKLSRQENIKLVNRNIGVGAAEEGPAEEEGAHLISR